MAMPMEYSTVTLEVTPQQASELILAQQVGNLRVVLSNLRAPTPGAVQVPRMDQTQLLAKLTGSMGGYNAEQGVQYIIGQGGGVISQSYAPEPNKAMPAQAVPADATQPAGLSGQQQKALQELKQMVTPPLGSQNPTQRAQ